MREKKNQDMNNTDEMSFVHHMTNNGQAYRVLSYHDSIYHESTTMFYHKGQQSLDHKSALKVHYPLPINTP